MSWLAALTLFLRASDATAQPAGYVIPPGQEAAVFDLLGGRDSLPGGCRFNGASINVDEIVARYACPGAEPTLHLRHPSRADAGDVVTARFALAPDAPFPPALLDALTARARQREGGFRWIASQSRPHDSRGQPVAPTAAMLAVVLAWVLFQGLPAAARRGPARVDALAGVALFALALALRLALPWGPGDFAEPERLQVLWAGQVGMPGFATVPSLARIAAIAGVSLRAALHAIGPVLGALNVVGVYFLARSAADRPAAAAAAFALLALPVHAHYSASAGIAVAGPAFWTLAWAAAAAPGPVGLARPALVAALAGLAAQSRPEMRALVLTLIPLAWMPGWTPRRRAALAGLVVLAFAPAALDVLHTRLGQQVHGDGSVWWRFLPGTLYDVRNGAPWVLLAGAAGLAVGRGPRSLRLALALGCLLLLAQFLTFAAETNPRWGQWRYLVALTPALCVGVALLLERAGAKARLAAAAAAALTLLALPFQVPGLLRRSDLAAELEFIETTAQRALAGRHDVFVLTEVESSHGEGSISYQSPVLMGLALGARRKIELPRSCTTDTGAAEPGRLGVWSLGPLLEGCSHAPSLEHAVVYLGASAPAAVMDAVRARFVLRPLALATVTAESTAPVYAVACRPATDRGGDCAMTLGWYALETR